MFWAYIFKENMRDGQEDDDRNMSEKTYTIRRRTSDFMLNMYTENTLCLNNIKINQRIGYL